MFSSGKCSLIRSHCSSVRRNAMPDDTAFSCGYIEKTDFEIGSMQLAVGMNATLQPEPDNLHDPHAIMVLINGKKVGYIGPGLLNALHRWLHNRSEISAVIEKMNGRPERPSIMLYISVVPERLVEHAFAS